MKDRAMRMFCFDVCSCGSIALGFLYAAVTAGDDDAFSCCREMGVRCFCVRPYCRTFCHRRRRDDEFDAGDVSFKLLRFEYDGQETW